MELIQDIRVHKAFCRSIEPGTEGRPVQIESLSDQIIESHDLTLPEWFYWYEMASSWKRTDQQTTSDLEVEAEEVAERTANRESDRECAAGHEATSLIRQYREARKVADSLFGKLMPAVKRIIKAHPDLHTYDHIYVEEMEIEENATMRVEAIGTFCDGSEVVVVRVPCADVIEALIAEGMTVETGRHGLGRRVSNPDELAKVLDAEVPEMALVGPVYDYMTETGRVDSSDESWALPAISRWIRDR